MGRNAILASTALLTLGAAPAAFAQATAEQATAIRTVITGMLGGLGDGAEIKGDVTVTAAGDRYDLAIPEIVVGNDVHGPIWSVAIAPFAGTITPAADDVYTVALSLPATVTRTVLDRDPIVVSGGGSLSFTFSAASGLPSALTLALTDLDVTGMGSDTISLGSFALKARTVASAVAPHLSDVLIALGGKDLSVDSGDNSVGFGGATLEFAATGLDIPAIVAAVHTADALYLKAEQARRSEIQAVLNEAAQAFYQLPKLIDGFRFGYSLQMLDVATDGGLVAIDDTGFGFEVAGMAGDSTSVRVTAGLSVLDAPVDDPVFRPYLPQYGALDMALTGIPNGLIAATVAGAVNAGAATGADEPDELGELLLQSLATVLLTSDLALDVATLEISAPAAAIAAEGSAAPDPASPLMTRADATIVVRGFEAAIATASGLPDGMRTAQALTVFQALGTAAVDDEGDPIRRYAIALGSDGKILVNGTDIAPLIAGR